MAADLEPEQRELLAETVEAERDLPRELRGWFYVATLGEGEKLQGRGGHVVSATKADLDELEARGYLRRDFNGNYTLTNDSRAWYADLRQREGQPVEHIDAEIR